MKDKTTEAAARAYDAAFAEHQFGTDPIGTFIAALEAEGMVIVPAEPTREMLDAGESASEDSHDESRDSYGTYSYWSDMNVANAVYRAMISVHRKE